MVRARPLAVFIGPDLDLSKAKVLDEPTKRFISESLSRLSFKAAKGKVQSLTAPIDSPHQGLFVIGLDSLNPDQLALEHAVGSLYHAAKSIGYDSLDIDMTDFDANCVARARYALDLAAYRFDVYFGADKQEKAPKLNSISINQ